MPVVKVSITGVIVELDASEISVQDLTKLAVDTLKQVSTVEDGKVRPGASGFTTQLE